MVSFPYKRIITIQEMAFGMPKDSLHCHCDVAYLHSSSEERPPTRKMVISHEQFTLENDLTESADRIFEGFNKNYKYEIRRAEKECVKCKMFVSSDCIPIIEEFESIYNKMFLLKGLRNKFNKKLVLSGVSANQIYISKAWEDNFNCIVYHAYLADSSRTVLMYSASTLSESNNKETSNMIGRMNKYLHWFDLLWFKENGYLAYEWGGINSKDNPDGIARFKMGFNGMVKKYVNYLIPNSLPGLVYVKLVKKRGTGWA